MKILVVEDDAIVATIYSRALTNAGYEVDVIADGSDAFHALHVKRYELVLLDIMLPNMDGLAILRRIRAQKKFQFLPILVITGMQMPSVQTQILNAGASMVLSKAEVSPQKLVQAVKELIAAAPAPPLELLPEPIIEEVTQKLPDLRVNPPEAPSSPSLQLRLADEPEPPSPRPSAPRVPPPPQVRLKDEAEEGKKKGGFFGRLFGKK